MDDSRQLGCRADQSAENLGFRNMRKLVAVFVGLLCLSLIVIAGLLAMPMHAVFWALGVNDQYMATCYSAGETLRDKVKAFLEA